VNRLRFVIGALGVLAIGFGAVLAVTGLGLRSVRLAIWLGAPVAIHDGIVVPLALALGWAGRRLLPRPAWGPAAAGLVVTGTLLALAAVVLPRPSPDPALPSLLDRNYPAGLAVALGLVWSITAVAAAFRLRSARTTAGRGGEVPSVHGAHEEP
jgi:hypothetical protein